MRMARTVNFVMPFSSDGPTHCWAVHHCTLSDSKLPDLIDSMANYLKRFLGVSFFIVSLNMKENKICLSILYQFAKKSDYQSKYQ